MYVHVFLHTFFFTRLHAESACVCVHVYMYTQYEKTLCVHTNTLCVQTNTCIHVCVMY